MKFLPGMKARFHPYSLLPPSFCQLELGLKPSCSGQSHKWNLSLSILYSKFLNGSMLEMDAMVVLLCILPFGV